jgi:subtilase family serine protease
MSCSRRRVAQVVAIVAVAMGAASLVGAAGAGASDARRAVGTAARLPLGARRERALPAARQLRLTIALKPHDAAGLRAFATAVSTPGTPQYGRYLSVAQFARRFGAGPSQLAAVSAAMRAGGLRVGAPSANHLTISVTGTVAQVQRAFAVTESRVRLPDGGLAFANDRAPRLGAQIAGSVQAVLGLDDVGRQRPQGLVRPALRRPAARVRAVGSGPAPCAAAAGAAASMGYTADQVAGAYGIGAYYPSDEGAGQTVALVEFEAYDLNDIAVYEQCYGTSTAIANVEVDGGPGAFSGNDDESALDIEQVIGLAPKANIRVYQASPQDSQFDVLDAIASENVAKVVSSSWGMCEVLTTLPVIEAENTVLEEMAVQGQSFFNSSGDSGSTMCYQTPSGSGGARDASLSVIDPGSQPFATGVGGTFLGNADGTVSTGGAYGGEAVWNDGGADAHGDQAAGTGGGVSAAWTMPTYQSSAAAGLGVVQAASSSACGASLCREVPDVSADGDPNSGYVVWATDPSMPSGGWALAGGTSASAPLWAAFTALANASPVCRGFALGFENPSLYAIAGNAYAANFHDVTAPSPFTAASTNVPRPAISPGTNDTWSDTMTVNANNPNHLYPVLPGYDMTTGLGSPITNVLGNSLCALRAPVYTVHLTAPGNQLTITGHAVSLAVHGTDSGNATLTYSATGLPAGLAINAATGVISGTPTTQQTTTVTVRATDTIANTAATSLSWTVVAPGAPQLTRTHRLSGLGRGRPKLSFSLAAGPFAPALKAITIRLPRGLSFATTARALAKGTVVKSGSTKVAFSLARRGGALTIAFRVAVAEAAVTVGVPALEITVGEAAKVRAHKIKKLALALKAIDASRETTRLSVTFTRLS